MAYPTSKSPLLRRFVDDERGAALILVTVMLPVLVGFALLAIDMSRVNNLHNDLQKAADAMALAAAAELDGKDDSETRAVRAINNLVQNTTKFSDLGNYTVGAGDLTWRFLESLPASDSSPIDDDPHLSEEPAESQFVEVRATPVGFSSIFPAVFLGGDDTFDVGATAVAGFAGIVVCDMTPLFICNPYEGMLGADGEPMEFHEAANSENLYGRGLRLVSNDGGSAGAWGPGNFGFLRPTDDHGYGAQELASDIARAHLRECANTQGVHFRTGGPAPATRAAINVRFDIFEQGFSRTDPTIPPAPNVRKGYKYKNNNNPSACNMEPGADPTRFRQMTPDQTYVTGFPKLGNGDWDYVGYLQANNLTDTVLNAFVDEDGQPYDNDNPPSRYDLYMFEFRNNLMETPSVGGERGRAECHQDPPADPDRRLIYGAVVNCLEHADDLNGQSGAPVPAVGYASFFLTEPVAQATTNGDIMAEIVDIDGIHGRGTMVNFARDNVQLYR